ncbi:MAG TPA: hypothetical protein VF755_12200 [Catenuloplanes sp.]|jgi:hypothetical protein
MPYLDSLGPRAERPLPRDDDDELTWLLFHQSNVIAGWQLRRFLSEAALRHRVRAGRWQRDVNRVGAPPHTTNARSLVDAARWAGSDDQARAIIASGFQQRLVGGDDIHEVVYRVHRLPRRSLILAAANDAREGSASLPELRYLRASRRAGLPEPSRQHRRVDGSGRTRYLDVYYRPWGVHVEIDGAQHLDVRAQWADMKRQNDVWISGDRVLRFPAWLVREHPDEVIAQVRAALTAAGWRPS